MDHKLYLTDKGIYKVDTIFYFHKNGQKVTDEKTLQRLSKFVVPPAWKNVWYASNPKCHIQVHGIDGGGKKQYILSEKWILYTNSEKFNRMKNFIKNINHFKRKIKLYDTFISKETLIKLLFNLLIDLHIRVGNEIYAEQNKTYGLTTLRQKHCIKSDKNYIFKFIGKSYIEHSINIPPEYNVWINNLIVEGKQNKNKPLFYYYENGIIHTIQSDELNQFLKNNMGKEYTCKDFRTYSANMLFIKSFLKNAKNKIKSNPYKIVLQSIDESAKLLGHTRSISRKSYISNTLIDYCVDSFTTATSLSSSELLSKVWLRSP
jgi:DNA topoisomerase-1